MEGLPKGDFVKHYNRTLKIMRSYLDGNKPTKNREEYIPEFTILVDYTEYLHRCHENVVQTDYFINRGLSQKAIDKFKLGYDPEKNLVTIPYNPDCKGYVHRILWDSDNKYCKFGNEIFNINALYEPSIDALICGSRDYVFICEGQIDAMSFEELAEVELGQQYIVISDLYGKYKDANEFLIADREGFAIKMKTIVNKMEDKKNEFM